MYWAIDNSFAIVSKHRLSYDYFLVPKYKA
jgi:hypothetical protein